MDIKVLSPGAFASVAVNLLPGERFISESGLMVRMTASVDVDITTKTKGKGGLLAAAKRMLGGDSFFMSTYVASEPSEVVLAPILPGDCRVMQLDGSTTWVCAGASYMASGPDVALDTKFQGLKGFFSGESLFFVEASGTGPLIVNAFGAIRELQIDGDYTIDTGHVVAYEAGLQYKITKAGGSWMQSYLAGEGFVMNFSGRGTVLVQSHNPAEFGSTVGPMLPGRA